MKSGTSMRLDCAKVRLVSQGKGGMTPTLDREHIPRLRKLLRTDKSLDEIAAEFGIERQSLARFIKRRQICNITERNKFIALQKSLNRFDARAEEHRLELKHKAQSRPHSSDVEQPHCRRTRADSSPAAGTNSSVASSPGDKAATVSHTPGAPAVVANSFSFPATPSRETAATLAVSPTADVAADNSQVRAC